MNIVGFNLNIELCFVLLDLKPIEGNSLYYLVVTNSENVVC